MADLAEKLNKTLQANPMNDAISASIPSPATKTTGLGSHAPPASCKCSGRKRKEADSTMIVSDTDKVRKIETLEVHIRRGEKKLQDLQLS